MRNETCLSCGDDFDISHEDFDNDTYGEYCDECREVLDGAENPELIIELASHFGTEVKSVVELDSDTYQIDGIEYKVLDEYDADEAVKDYIVETLWAFRPEFLANETGIPMSMFEALANNGMCESNNEAVEDCINATCGMDEFVDSAVSADGRGRFLNCYDGEEHELSVNGESWYAYRT